MKLLLFEWKKMFRLKVPIILFLLTLICVSGLFIRNTMQQELIKEKKIETFSKYKSQVTGKVMYYNELLKKVGNSQMEEELTYLLPLVQELEKLLEHVQQDRWKEEVETEIKVYELADHYEAKYTQSIMQIGKKDRQKESKLNNELLERGLPKEDLDLSLQPAVFMKNVVSFFLAAPGFIVLLLLVGIVITKEFEDSTIKMVYALPISRATYTLVKFASLLVVGFVWLTLLFLLAYFLPTVFGPATEGDIFNYPLYTKEEAFMSTGTYVMQAIVYSIGYVTFALALFLFLAFLIRNTIVTYVLVFFLLLGGVIVSKNGVDIFVSPFTYQQVDHVILNVSAYYPTGLVVLIASTVILLFVTVEMNRKRGI
ncbi:ABC transporter permease [Priestia taiwanensis]|uniref:Uncharacterized protein n=1 Tax=Priestia taiwanensis TaxID=1347902 RepID=A0A917AX82_9BACI|nr:ABC transporter permease subunit [Priestia taiwanensis]MBM7365268.1 ABC-type transport system involved in multi-copper enzyme maturation permease subunit [Priestia taiwanensis]GGE85660.1 hypothetical protein GCM10007140_38800 [Priestia taiwanensis]